MTAGGSRDTRQRGGEADSPPLRPAARVVLAGATATGTLLAVSLALGVTDAHLVTLARRHDIRLVTFDAGIVALAGGHGVELLAT